MVGVVSERWLDAVDARRAAPRSAQRPPAREREDRVELLELGDADRGGDVVEAVVVAEPRVLEPAARVGAALVARGSSAAATLLVVSVTTIPPSPVVICLFG